MPAPSRHRWLLTLTRAILPTLVASARLALAVSPLVTDDADTVEPGHLQLNADWQFSRTASVSLHSIPVNPVFGISSRGELGATFGYQWRDGSGSVPKQADADGITDLTLRDEVAAVATLARRLQGERAPRLEAAHRLGPSPLR